MWKVIGVKNSNCSNSSSVIYSRYSNVVLVFTFMIKCIIKWLNKEMWQRHYFFIKPGTCLAPEIVFVCLSAPTSQSKMAYAESSLFVRNEGRTAQVLTLQVGKLWKFISVNLKNG